MEEKDSYIRIRISEGLKKKFQEYCKKKAINGSELLRQQVERIVKEEEK